jgi:hypothetical protein
VEFIESALGILDLIDLLLLIYNISAGMNFNKVVGKQPTQSPRVAVVGGIQPDVVHDGDCGGDILTRSGRFLRRLTQRYGA